MDLWVAGTLFIPLMMLLFGFLVKLHAKQTELDTRLTVSDTNSKNLANQVEKALNDLRADIKEVKEENVRAFNQLDIKICQFIGNELQYLKGHQEKKI